MDTTFPARIHRVGTRRWSGLLLLATAAVAVVLVGALVVLFAQPIQAPVTRSSDGLSADQIVIRGEVADRLAQSANDGLSAEQIVIRGEVADRLAQSASDGFSPEQIVIRGEVADRLAQSASDHP